MASSQKLDVKIQIEGCTWSIIMEKDVKILTSGVCRVSQVKDTLIFMIGEETYALKQGMPVVLQISDERIVFVFKCPKDVDAMFGLSTANSKDAQKLAQLLRETMLIQEGTLEEEKKEEVKEGSKVAKYGNKLASVISKGGKLGLSTIDKGTEKTKRGIKIVTHKAKEKIPKKQEATIISESTKARVQKAKMASVMAVSVSSAMLAGAIEAANQMSDGLKPMLSEYLEKKGLKTDKPAGPKTEATINVTKQSVRATLELYIAMKEASLALMAASLDAGAELIEHRYGDDAGALAKDASEAVQNALEASQNLGGFGIKATAKKVMVDTVLKSVDQDEKKDVSEQTDTAATKPVVNESAKDALTTQQNGKDRLAFQLPVRETSKNLEMD